MRRTTETNEILAGKYLLLIISFFYFLVIVTSAQASTLTYNVTADASPITSGGPDCLSCHKDKFTGAHNNINSGATASGVDPANKKCWGCHQSDGTQPAAGSMGDRYKNAFLCADCHDSITKPYPGVGNALIVGSDNAQTGEVLTNIVGKNTKSQANTGFTTMVAGTTDKRHNGTIECGTCHNNNTVLDDIGFIQPNGTITYDKATAATCIDCHMTGTVQAGNSNFSTAYILTNNKFSHGNDVNNGSIWTRSGDTNYWSSQLSACKYCHGNATHSSTPIGKSMVFKDANIKREFGTWCTSCHYQGYSLYSTMLGEMAPVPPEFTGNATYGDYVNSKYFNHNGIGNFQDTKCKSCHGGGTELSSFMHSVTSGEGGPDCVSCHIDGGNVNRTAFSQGVHVNINNSDGNGLVNNSDCWTCHFNRDMNRGNIRQCADCHTGSGIPDAPTAPKIRTHVSGAAITNYSCVDCHSKVMNDPGLGIVNVTSHYLKRQTVPTVNYCDYCHGPNASSLFPATNKTIPGFDHDDPSWNGNATCRTCHSNSNVSADPRANDTSSFHDLTTELGDVNGTVKANCVLCHIQKEPQFVAAPSPPHDTSGYTVVDCRGCHTSGTGTDPQKLHSVTAFATGGCIGCHSNNATRYYVDTSLFGKHANVNATGGLDNVTDDDCKTCHFGAANGTMKMVLGAANPTNTWFCEDCHTSAGSGPIKPIDSNLIKDGLRHGLTNCQWCHIAGDSLPRPLINENESMRYHPNGPKGTASEKSCLNCHYNPTPAELLFHAPLEKHESDINKCSRCHNQASNHEVTPDPWSTNPPNVISLSVTTPVSSGYLSQINATFTDEGIRMAAARYQVTNSSGIIIDWTDMNPFIGFEYVNAIINTSGLLGNYNVNVKGMAWAPKVNISKPYFPLNGPWSGVSTVLLNVTQPTPALVSSITPNSRNMQIGTPVTLFMSVINYGTETATGVNINQASGLPASIGYQQWNGTAFTGSANTPADIAADATANYVLTINATSAFDTSAMTFNVSSNNGATAPIGAVNTLTISANATPSADVIMISTNLNVSTPVNNATAFALASMNVGGASATGVSLVVSLPISITGLEYQVNQTNPTTGALIGPATGLTIAMGDTPTFAVFLTPTKSITFDPMNDRMMLKLVDGTGKVIGAQSVAVSTK